MKARKVSVISVLALGLIGACSDGIDLPKPARMEKVGSGDLQRATAGNRLSIPFSVFITASDGSGVPREAVTWIVEEGSGADLSDSLTVTDGSGVAQAYLTLGPTAGSYVVRAALVRKPDAFVTFNAVAVSAPTVDGVTPSTFSGGMQVSLQGSHFGDSTVVEFNGTEAEVGSVSPTGLGLSVSVPQCLVPGAVTISVRVGLSGPSTVSGTFAASAGTLNLEPGEYVSAEPAALGGCATFPTAGPGGAEYLLTPQSVSATPGDTVWFRMKGDSVAAAIPVVMPVAADRPITLQFDDFLRGLEAELAERPRQPMTETLVDAAQIQLDIVVGDRRTFRVCDKVTCRQEEDFATVSAAVKYVGDHALIYQDEDAPAGGLNEADFQELGGIFDQELYGVATSAFGSESDVDQNGRVMILFTPIVNALTETAQCSQSYVTGFFFPLDVDPTAGNDNRSNQAELFYAMVPDPQGTVTCDHSVERVTRIVPVTFIHEFQHMISFHQHVILRAGSSENTWLNEAMSHVAEELAALHFESLGQSVRFSAFSLGDLYNGYKYLRDPASYYLLYDEGTGTLEERGASWLFLRWLADQFGPEVLRRLSETNLTSTENVMAATGEPMSKLLADWFLANYVSDNPDIQDIPERLSYLTWNLRDVYSSLYAQDRSLFDRPFPIEPVVFDGGIFDVSGRLGGGSGAYFLVNQAGGQRGFTAQLLDANGVPLAEETQSRLNVVRIR